MAEARIKKLLQNAKSLMAEKRWSAAIEVLRRDPSIVENQWEVSWNLGWCYFKLVRMGEAHKQMLRATKLAPDNHVPACKFGLGSVLLKKKQYRRAEVLLADSLRLKELYPARISLALAYLAQGKIEEAEKTHLDGITLKPMNAERYRGYAAFLSDVGRNDEADEMSRKADQLQRIH
jgi:Flp pilus assembly protein TadD